ncbi:WD40 repeat-containing protein [Thioploca ingrica]|uniref:WD40 repeat-containing protein n=1 Tax=Thioploca ingrica TaxID=40754 RepID=A0A090AL19_9GAMM|nr:WD40 repeat-containing protein [Thioploca ingrica]
MTNNTDKLEANGHQNEAGFDDIIIPIASDIRVGNKAVIQNITRHTTKSLTSSPYKHLAPYDLADKELFYGRQKTMQNMAKKIIHHKIVTLSGIAGSGKTSLINAGLIPLLANNGYVYVYFREYSDPLQQLHTYLSQYNFVAEVQFASLINLIQAIKFYQSNHIVIFFDQFEYFLTQVSSSKRYAFIKSLQHCLDQASLPEQKIKINLVFILQQDFLGQLFAEFETILPSLLSKATHLNLLLLNQHEAREAIIKPLTHLDVNISYDEDFINKILLTDLVSQTNDKYLGIYPPYLQIVCSQLYEAAYQALERQSTVIINQSLYDKLGGAKNILSLYLDNNIEKIVAEPQQIVAFRSLLKTMVQATPTRRFISLDNLPSSLPLSKTEIVNFVEQLRTRGLIEIHQQTFSLAYEFMIDQVRNWSDEARNEIEYQQAKKNLSQGLIEWQTKGTLLKESQINQIRQYLPILYETEQQLLTLSEISNKKANQPKEFPNKRTLFLAATRQLNFNQRLIATLFLVFIAISFGIYSYGKAIEVNQEKNQVLRSQSLFLAHLARQQTNQGNALNGMLLSLEALPIKKNRPYVSEAEGQLYHAAIRPHERYLLAGHKDRVFYATFSPNGLWLVTASGDNTARLWEVKTGQLVKLLQGHTGTVFHSTFSPNSQFILTSSNDKTARLWEVPTGKLIRIFKGHQQGIYHAAFSPDGQIIATASQDHTARLWEVATGNLINVLTGHSDWVKQVTFSPSGWLLVTASGDKTARVWEVSNGKLLSVLKGHDGEVYQASFSPDGQNVITVAADNTARLWEIRSGRLIHTFAGHHFWVASASFSPDGQYLVTAAFDHTARLWAVRNGQLLHIFKGHQAEIYHTSFSPDGQYIATASFDNTVRLWEVNTGQLVNVLRGHQANVYHVAFSPDGQYLVTSSSDQTARLWEIKSNQLLRILKGQTQGISQAAFSPDSQRLVTSSDDHTAYLWETNEGHLLKVLSGHEEKLTSTAFSPDGQYLVTASQDHTARLWPVKNGQVVKILKGHQGPIWYATFNPQSQIIITASADKTARLWQVSDGKLLNILQGHTDGVLYADFSPDGQGVVTAAEDGTARLWEVSSGESTQLFQGHKDAINYVAFSPNGQLILTASQDKTAGLWEVERGKLLHLLKGHEGALSSAAFSPDGQLVVTASTDKTARLWQVASGQLLNIFSGHEQPISHVAFSPDGNRIVTASADKTARLWEVASGRLLNVLTGHQAGVSYALFSPDNQQLVTVSKDSTAYLWPIFPNSQALIKHVFGIVGTRQLTLAQKQQFFIE